MGASEKTSPSLEGRFGLLQGRLVGLLSEEESDGNKVIIINKTITIKEYGHNHIIRITASMEYIIFIYKDKKPFIISIKTSCCETCIPLYCAA